MSDIIKEQDNLTSTMARRTVIIYKSKLIASTLRMTDEPEYVQKQMIYETLLTINNELSNSLHDLVLFSKIHLGTMDRIRMLCAKVNHVPKLRVTAHLDYDSENIMYTFIGRLKSMIDNLNKELSPMNTGVDISTYVNLNIYSRRLLEEISRLFRNFGMNYINNIRYLTVLEPYILKQRTVSR